MPLSNCSGNGWKIGNMIEFKSCSLLSTGSSRTNPSSPSTICFAAPIPGAIGNVSSPHARFTLPWMCCRKKAGFQRTGCKERENHFQNIDVDGFGDEIRRLPLKTDDGQYHQPASSGQAGFSPTTIHVHPIATTCTVTPCCSIWVDSFSKTASSSTGTNMANVTESIPRLPAYAAA